MIENIEEVKQLIIQQGYSVSNQTLIICKGKAFAYIPTWGHTIIDVRTTGHYRWMYLNARSKRFKGSVYINFNRFNSRREAIQALREIKSRKR